MNSSPSKSASKSLIPATLGTILEWAEYTFFAYMADQLSSHFFAIEDPNLARLKTYALFATSFFMRPLGAILFGSLGDRWGRKPALMISMLLMGFSTFIIGCLPTYSSIGMLAPILLLICRLLQGVAVAGEFHGAIVFLHEYAAKRPFFVGCFAPFAAASGMSLGAFAAMLTQLPSAPSFAWRIPFWCSGFLCFLALYLRRNIDETPVFQNVVKHKKCVRFPLALAWKENKKGLFLTFSLSVFTAVSVYLGNVFYKVMIIKAGGLDPQSASSIITIGQILSAISILSFGWFSDKIGGKKLCQMGLFLGIFAGPCIFYFAQSGDFLQTLYGQILYALVNGMVSSTMMTLLMREFQAETRFSGSSLGWSIGAAIFGGTALLVADALVTQLGFAMAPGFYISITAFLGWITVKSISRENREDSSQEEREFSNSKLSPTLIEDKI